MTCSASHLPRRCPCGEGKFCMAGVQGDKNMADYIKGVDLSAVVEVEELGAKYYDNGVQGDIFDILKNYGVNSVRLRLWNDP